MDQDDSAGADPQQTIRDLEQQAEKDKDALDKLLVAYQAQEADIAEMKAQVETLNRELIDKRPRRRESTTSSTTSEGRRTRWKWNSRRPTQRSHS